MSQSANVLGAFGQSGRPVFTMAQRTTSATSGTISPAHLMAQRSPVGLPLLEGVSTEQRFLSDDSEAIALAEILVKSRIAVEADWEKGGRDPTKYLWLTLQRWIQGHGGSAIDRRFDLDVTISDRLVDYSDERAPRGTLYLILDPEAAAFVLLNPTLELLEKEHRQFPSTFFSHFAGALNRWVRIYDYRDAEERVDMLRQWYEGEENVDQYELPDVEACTPQSLKEKPLSLRELISLRQTITNETVTALLEGLFELCRASEKAKRPEFTEEMGEQLMDSNPPLPCLLAAFAHGDAVVGCFDDESQTALEVIPQPNLIIPLQLSNPDTVHKAFRILGIACETLAAASRLIDLMPGNDDGVITREA
ncbi:MAG TPA: hypothetical protein VF011_15195 [Terriglobales bacterium]